MLTKYFKLFVLLLITDFLQAKELPHASYLDPGSFLVAEVAVDEAIEVAQSNTERVIQFCKKNGIPLDEEIDEAAITQIRGMLKIAQGFGIETARAYLSLEDIKIDYGPLVVVRVKEGTSTKATHLMLQGLVMNGPAIPLRAELGIDDNSILVGMPKTLARYKKINPTTREDLIKALESAEGIARLVYSPGEDARRVIRELWPSLPWPFESLSGELLADRLLYVAADIQVDEAPQLSVRFQLTDDRSAELASELLQIGFAQALTQLAKEDSSSAELINMLQEFPKVQQYESTVEVRLDFETKGQELLNQRVIAAIHSAREAAKRAKRMNDFKQVGLAMHNFHEVNNQFPAPAAICDDQGKPLLSWRVAILPFLEQNALYDQFHLDEPWDSPHNLKLLETMPAVYVNKHHPELAAQGKTTIVRAIFDGYDEQREASHDKAYTPSERTHGTKVYYLAPWLEIADYVDGTSNTALIVEVDSASAVPWTKPVDWEVDLKNPKKGLFGKPNQKGTPATAFIGFADGSVRVRTEAIDPEMLRRILDHHDGKSIKHDPNAQGN